MKTLIADDDFISRLLMEELLRDQGKTDVVLNGKDAVAAVQTALQLGEPYDLVCMDLMMPEMDGQQALEKILALEQKFGAKNRPRTRILMLTAMQGEDHRIRALQARCDGYLSKPIATAKLQACLRGLGLLEGANRKE